VTYKKEKTLFQGKLSRLDGREEKLGKRTIDRVPEGEPGILQGGKGSGTGSCCLRRKTKKKGNTG